jgi:uncharacterized heparinase superfamily protein
VLEVLPFLARTSVLRAADAIVTAPWVRWTWTGLADDTFTPAFVDFRPSDPDAVRDMMAGRYLLAGRLVDTQGLSPFAVDVDHDEWLASLYGFAWLRHFREVRDPAARGFARTLVLDWIGNEGDFFAQSWTPALTAQRVLNWLRHLDVLTAGASSEQVRTIQRSLSTQVQSLTLRTRFTADPPTRLLAAAALTGAALCDADQRRDVDAQLTALNAILAEQLDTDGMHLSRNPRQQLHLLVELASIRLSLGGLKSAASLEFAAQVDRMHEALDALTLGTGEPAYFNGGGQLPHDTLIAVQAHGGERRRRSGLVGGYAILRDGDAVVVADAGRVPPLAFAAEAHAGALAFEFSHGTELIVGNCGPAPVELTKGRDLFRQGIAHSAPTIDGESAQEFVAKGPFKGHLRASGPLPKVDISSADNAMVLTMGGYARRNGLFIERRITLLSGGTTLVGQDRLQPVDGGEITGTLSLHFHLAAGTMVRRTSDGMVRLILANGAVWTFLWEGAALHEDDSVRHSASLGFHKTRQLVLEAEARADTEIAWIFTREE